MTMVQTRSNANEVLAALVPNREVVVEDVAGGPTGGKAGPAGSQGKKKKVRRSQKKKATKHNGKAVMADALSRLEEEDESSSFERMSAFDRLGDPKSKKPRTSAFERLQDTRSARKGDLRDTLKEKRGESTATSKVGSEERRTTVGDKGTAELWKMYEQLEKRLDAQNPYRTTGRPIPKTTSLASGPTWSYKWSDLANKFLEHFASSRRQKLPFSHLLNVKIRKGEQLREFINRAKYLALEEDDDEPPVWKEKKSGPPVAEGKKRKDYGKGSNPTGYHANRHPVHAVQSLPTPPHGRESYGVQDAPKYCEYHRNSTHNTSECVTLKKEMDQLIARGPPPRSERQSSSNRTWRRPPAPTAAITAGEGQEDGRRHLGRDCDDLDEEERQGRRHLGCRFIMGGNTGGDSVSSRKRWKNMVYLAEVQRPPLPKRKKKEPLIFTDEDYPQVLSPHRDALVIRVEINNVVVHRTLVDTGSSVNVMYSNTFKELGLSRSDLKPIHTPLSGFTGDTIEAEGTVTMKAGVGDGTHRLWIDMEFMVVQLDCAHHLILGRPGLEDLECVISPAHLCLKFNTPTGVGVAKGNQSLSRSCYVRATKSQARVDENVSTICAAIQKEEGRPRAEPAEEVEEVSLDPVEPERKVKIEFKPRPAIKGQALADFVVECTAREVESSGEEPEGNWWTVYTDGSSATDASGGGVVAISPKGFKAYYSVRFRFKVSNNEAEYEALLCGLRLAASLKAERIQVRCDSKLVVGHVTGEFEAKDERMKKYRDTALELLKAFGAYRIDTSGSLHDVQEGDPTRILLANDYQRLRRVRAQMQGLPGVPEDARATGDELHPDKHGDSLCSQIITDNGTQFKAGGFNEFLQSWGIKHSYAAVGYPQTNGQVENTNRTIMDGLKKKIMECKSAWVEELPYILWTYRTTPRKATGETPFSLIYGFEARAPAETSLLSYRVETFDAQENEENLRAELHLIDERRERAYMRAENYRRQVKSYHNQRVRPRQFKMGDWVLRKREVSRPTDGGKFAKSFEGPYIIKEVLADGTFRLQTPTGGDVPRVWNAANLIKFYQ
ncbi:unnamed protein product [Cuscuta campestris]|uniref:Integrase catalytic domain-containing protein n=1 Tax=Cuscuta campestris TaxID=132261 RepID=A0A484LJH1_9ASTE|nr:unnamed protein product [Cuscuta campestris]